jgi:hypothetical protein
LSGSERKERGINAISTTYSYDSAQRLTAVNDGAGRTIKTFEFSSANSGTGSNTDYQQGKLYQAIRYNYLNAGTIIVTETYKYSGLGGRLNQRSARRARAASS